MRNETNKPTKILAKISCFNIPASDIITALGKERAMFGLFLYDIEELTRYYTLDPEDKNKSAVQAMDMFEATISNSVPEGGGIGWIKYPVISIEGKAQKIVLYAKYIVIQPDEMLEVKQQIGREIREKEKAGVKGQLPDFLVRILANAKNKSRSPSYSA